MSIQRLTAAAQNYQLKYHNFESEIHFILKLCCTKYCFKKARLSSIRTISKCLAFLFVSQFILMQLKRCDSLKRLPEGITTYSLNKFIFRRTSDCFIKLYKNNELMNHSINRFDHLLCKVYIKKLWPNMAKLTNSDSWNDSTDQIDFPYKSIKWESNWWMNDIDPWMIIFCHLDKFIFFDMYWNIEFHSDDDRKIRPNQ